MSQKKIAPADDAATKPPAGEDQFRSVWENSADAMRLADAKGTIVAVNAAFCRLVGLKREELEGQPLTVTYSDKEDLAKILRKFQQRFQEGTVSELTEAQLIFRSGRAAILEVSNSLVLPQSQTPLMLSVFRDVTEKRRREHQVLQTEKMDSIGRLAGGIAGDFKDIFTAIQTASGLLAGGKISALQLADVSRQISGAADRAVQLNRQLLIFSHRLAPQLRTVEVREFFETLTPTLRHIFPENIHLHVEPVTALPLVDMDPELLEQALTNMAMNSRDAMPKGGVFSVSASERLVDEVYAQQNFEAQVGRHVCLRVSDTGCGISPDHLPHIFEPFFSTKEARSGFGLSLATVYGILKQHRGWITVRSEPEGGTTFEMFLPVSTRKTKSEGLRPVEKKAKASTETILVVEDESVLLELTRHFLESNGFKVLTALSGVDALPVWEAHKDKIDLLFTDIVMPGGLNGRQLAEKLLAENPKLKIVYTSGYSAGILGKNFVLQEGVNFLQKPYHRRQLVKIVRQVLDAK